MTTAELLAKFHQAAPTLQRAIDRAAVTTMTLEDYKDRVMSGDFQLWLGDDYAAITEVLHYPQCKSVIVHIAAGNMSGVMGQEGPLRQFAEIVEADMIECYGREGWVRKLAPLGWEKAGIHMVLEVDHGRQQRRWQQFDHNENRPVAEAADRAEPGPD